LFYCESLRCERFYGMLTVIKSLEALLSYLRRVFLWRKTSFGVIFVSGV